MTVPEEANGGNDADEASLKEETHDEGVQANTARSRAENAGGHEHVDELAVTTGYLDEENDNNNDNDDDSDRDPETMDARELKYRHWEQSAFAVGCVNTTWQDDRTWFRPRRSRFLPVNSQVMCSAYVCGCLGAKRVGNLAVLAQTTEEYDHVEIINEETGEQEMTRRKRPRLLWVLGPYWPVNFFLTYPLILGISFWIGWRHLPDAPLGVVIAWSCCTFLLVFSLAMIACRNPGVLYRHRHRPTDGDDWRWNDQAKTFRHPKARFDPECQVVVEGFDHTCPWTGTAIGSQNMFWFRIFVTMVPVCIALAIMLSMFTF